jgi:hypothetical protein
MIGGRSLHTAKTKDKITPFIEAKSQREGAESQQQVSALNYYN